MMLGGVSLGLTDEAISFTTVATSTQGLEIVMFIVSAA